MGIIILSLLVFFANVFLFLEYFIIPKTSKFGIIGFTLIIASFIYSYINFNIFVSLFILGLFVISLLILGIPFAINFFRRNKKNGILSLHATIKSTVANTQAVSLNDRAVTVTRLNPIGTILVNNKKFEAESHFGFVDENTDVTIIEILKTKIIVKQKKIKL